MGLLSGVKKAVKSVGNVAKGALGAVGGLAGSVLGGGAAQPTGSMGAAATAVRDNSGIMNYLAQQQATAQQTQLANQQQNAQLMQGGGMVPGGAPAVAPQQQPMMGADPGYDANTDLAATLKALRGY